MRSTNTARRRSCLYGQTADCRHWLNTLRLFFARRERSFEASLSRAYAFKNPPRRQRTVTHGGTEPL